MSTVVHPIPHFSCMPHQSPSVLLAQSHRSPTSNTPQQGVKAHFALHSPTVSSITKMSHQSTPQRPSQASSYTFTATTPRDQSSRIRFRADGSLLPDSSPVMLTSPMRTPDPRRTSRTIQSELDLDRQLTSVLTRFFSTLNSEDIFIRTLGKLAPETELDILGDVDGWNYLEGSKKLSRERKMALLELYGVYDRKMKFVMKQSGL